MTKASDNEAFARIVQTAIGLEPDGWAGAGTRKAFEAWLARQKPQPKPLPQPAPGPTPVDPNDALLAEELERDEAFVPYAYKDSLGLWTIGIGRLVDKSKAGAGITREEALYLKRNDIARFKAELDDKAPWWRDLDPVRQRVILNMTFNMGSGWVKTWPATVGMIQRGEYARAADEMLQSKWAKQVKTRATRLAKMMRTGVA